MRWIVGSSPRVWGQDKDLTQAQLANRIIPTRMGTSHLLQVVIISFQDHPHAYGDKRLNFWKEYEKLGSSPRVWGQALGAQ